MMMASFQTKKNRFTSLWKEARSSVDTGDISATLAGYERAFYFWEGNRDFIQEYLCICNKVQKTEVVREITQKAGIFALRQYDIDYALDCFNKNLRVYSALGFGDKYKYSENIQSALKEYRPDDKYSCNYDLDQKPRIGFLIFGAEHPDSVLVRIAIDYVKNFDSNYWEINFFSSATNSIYRKMNEKLFSQYGKKLICCDSFENNKSIAYTINKLADFSPNIIISNGVLADYKNYFIITRFPNTLHVALTYGPPEQFVPFDADFVVAPDESLLFDAPADGAVVPLQLGSLVSERTNIGNLRAELLIPKSGTIIMSAGRQSKFENSELLENILFFLEEYVDCYFIAVGPSHFPSNFISRFEKHSAFKRMKTVEWNSGYKEYLKIADIFIDTFPSGGGITIVDAMAASAPVLTFNNHLNYRFTQVDWRPGKYYVPDSFLIVEANDWIAFREKLRLFVTDENLRKTYSKKCKSHVMDNLSDPSEMVFQVDKILRHLLRSRYKPQISQLSAKKIFILENKNIYFLVNPFVNLKKLIKLVYHLHLRRLIFFTKDYLVKVLTSSKQRK